MNNLNKIISLSFFFWGGGGGGGLGEYISGYSTLKWHVPFFNISQIIRGATWLKLTNGT